MGLRVLQEAQIEGEKLKLIENINNLETALKEAQDEKKDQIKEKIEKARERLKVVEQTEVA